MHDDVGVGSGRESWRIDWQRMPMEVTSALDWWLASGVIHIGDEDVARVVAMAASQRWRRRRR
jgi:hypothetical protein